MSRSKFTSTKTKLNAEIKYYKFELLSDIIQPYDNEWSIKFKEYARGFFPRELCYNEPKLIFKGKGNRSKNNEINLRTEDDDDSNVYLDLAFKLIEFIGKKCNIQSTKDKEASIQAFEDKRTEFMNDEFTWNTATTKDREIMVGKFAEKYCISQGMRRQEAMIFIEEFDQLYKSNRIPKTAFIVHGKEIVSIEGLTFDSNSREYSIPKRKIKITKNSTKAKPKKDTTINIADKMCKYLSDKDEKYSNLLSNTLADSVIKRDQYNQDQDQDQDQDQESYYESFNSEYE